jgi:hypothetical protein
VESGGVRGWRVRGGADAAHGRRFRAPAFTGTAPREPSSWTANGIAAAFTAEGGDEVSYWRSTAVMRDSASLKARMAQFIEPQNWSV